MTLLFLGFLCGITTCWLFKRRVLEATHIDGRRAGIQEAIALAKMRRDVAAQCAPPGQLTFGLARAQMCDNIELDLRGALREAR